MNFAHACPKCGVALPADAPRGHCPQCLLGLALEDQPTLTSISNPPLPGPRSYVEPPETETKHPVVGTRLGYVGDYELLEEIARGGMGVVYRARQSSLKRIVAVKMIRSGEFAGEAEVKRFRAEAEAAANLKHPNIVAIHEIGEHEGRHYFSMDFVAGQNLAQVCGGQPVAARQAGEWLKAIAEAVQFAHQRGVLHRDLKPQNILVDAEGRPHVTDFGLAKNLHADGGVTQTGAVMGSPSYMPPEQALGRQADIGPASDVYSLGAILYQMLTGKVPFTGATAVETLRAVVEQEPVAPAKLNDRVPADLETICLKCLEKKPERRYASARALAEELDRFLNHEPILAKPASAARKVVSWCRQRPWVVSALAVLLVLGLTGLAYGLWQKSEYLQWRMANPKSRPPGELTIAPAILLLTGAVLWIVTIMASVHWTEVKRQRLAPIPSWIMQLAKWVAGIQVLISIGLALTTIRLLVWFLRDHHQAMGLGLTGLFVSFAIGWTGMLVFWRFARLGEVIGLLDQLDQDRPGFRLELNWPRLLVVIPLFLVVSPPLVNWFVATGQFKPPEGTFPGVEGPMGVTDPAFRKVVDKHFVQLFWMVAGTQAVLVSMAGAFRKMPRNEWRDFTPPIVFMCLGFGGFSGMFLPGAVAAVAVGWGVLAGLALLKAAGLRRIEFAHGVDAHADNWSATLNHPAYKRTLPWVFLGLTVCALLLTPGKLEDRAFYALVWLSLAHLVVGIGQFRSLTKNARYEVVLGAFLVGYALYAFTGVFPNVYRSVTNLKYLPCVALALVPPAMGGYFLHRALKKPKDNTPASGAKN